MASCNNSIKINSDVNTVNIQPDNNKITVVNPDCCAVNISQPVTNVIQVATPGITGPTGPSGSVGPAGPSGSAGSFDSGSFVTTSSFNSFTSSIQSEVDSLTSVTSSYVLNSQTGSFATTGSNNFVGNQVITGSLTVSGSSTFTNIGPAVFTGTSTFTNITASGNISASGNIISTEVTTSKITSGDGSLILGFAGSNNVTIENGADFFINAPDGTIEIATGDGAKIEVSDVVSLQNPVGTSAIEIGNNIVNFGSPANRLISNSFLSSSNVITTEVTASKITSGDGSLILGYNGSNNITIENTADFFINSPDGEIQAIGNANTQLVIGDNIQLRGSGSSPGITVATPSITFHQPVTASGNISSSATITANAFVGGGSGITGVVSASYALTASHALNAGGGGGAGFPFAGDAVITGSLVINASSSTSQSLSVVGSGSTVFNVVGSVGTLFSVDDDLTGTLFTANDISGFPVLEASASGDVYIGKSPQSLYTTAVVSSTTAATTHSLSSLSTSSYDGAFFEYTAHSGSNARTGNIMSTWNGSNIVFAETTTTDIGNTTDLTTEVVISQSQAQFIVYGANAGYKVKTIIKAI